MSESSHKIQVTVAIIGLIGVLGAAVIANWDKIFPERSTDQRVQKVVERESARYTPSDGQALQGSGISGCFEEYFSGLPQDRIAILEVGIKDFQLIGPPQSKDETIAIQLEEKRQPVGAVKFQFYSQNTIFKIESLVDSECQPVEDYVNASRGGDKHNLQNWDDLQVRLGNAAYTLTLEYGAGRIDADFVKISPEN